MGEAERMTPDRVKALYERLPEDDRGVVVSMLEHLAKKADPVAWALDNAPLDDEPTTEADLKAIEEALAEPGAIPWEQVKEELGL